MPSWGFWAAPVVYEGRVVHAVGEVDGVVALNRIETPRPRSTTGACVDGPLVANIRDYVAGVSLKDLLLPWRKAARGFVLELDHALKALELDAVVDGAHQGTRVRL